MLLDSERPEVVLAHLEGREVVLTNRQAEPALRC